MNNTEQQLNALRSQLDRLDTTTARNRIETNLRSAWQQTNSTNTTMENIHQPKQHNWRIFNYVLGGSGLAVLAIITTVITQSSVESVPTRTNQTIAAFNNTSTTPTKPGKYLDSSTALGASDAAPSSGVNIQDLNLPDFEIGEPTLRDTPSNNNNSYYKEDGKTKQVFSESVGLSIEVTTDALQVIHSLREEVTKLNGYLLTISYADTNGTLNIKLPADQLTAFEDSLKALDVDQQIEVTRYNVTNESSEVVAMDEYIKTAEDQIKELEAIVASNESTATERSDANKQLEVTRNIIEDSKVLRTKTIANYNLIDVTVTVAQYQSFWEGNYTQYDRSTFSGQIKYEFGHAIYSLIHSTSKVLAFLIWLAVYSVILIPIFLLIRLVIRKIIRSVRNQYQR